MTAIKRRGNPASLDAKEVKCYFLPGNSGEGLSDKRREEGGENHDADAAFSERSESAD